MYVCICNGSPSETCKVEHVKTGHIRERVAEQATIIVRYIPLLDLPHVIRYVGGHVLVEDTKVRRSRHVLVQHGAHAIDTALESPCTRLVLNDSVVFFCPVLTTWWLFTASGDPLLCARTHCILLAHSPLTKLARPPIIVRLAYRQRCLYQPQPRERCT